MLLCLRQQTRQMEKKEEEKEAKGRDGTEMAGKALTFPH